MKKSTKIWSFIGLLLLVLVGGGVYAYTNRDTVPTFETVEVTRQTVTQTVDATGMIRKADPFEVDDEGEVTEDPIIETGDEIVVDVLIAESDILKIKKGQTATMTLGAFGSDVEFTGKVLDVAEVPTPAEGVVMYAVEISLDGRTDDAKGDMAGVMTGMSADVTIVTNAYKNVLAAPSRAIVKKDGATYVRMPDATEEDGYVERQVVTGARGDSGLIVITSGIREGDDIIVDLD